MIPNASVDVVVANGVFEHIEIEDLTRFLEEFYRIVKPSGVVSFNFDNIMTAEGIQWFKKWRGEPETKGVFRFYHPDAVRQIAESFGFVTLQLTVNDSRLAHIELEKPLLTI
jgi:predicted SAM-dependent methyltransferase